MDNEQLEVNVGTLTSTIKLENAKELQQLIKRTSRLTNQLKEAFQQIEHFELKS
ncbi:hypothetical protein M3638_02865 [Oceanobacillus profundus]|uniref:hypothetical protein n=1 Tax=Oceanobacillus profundus TaxID=372463 RepID=UPI00203D8E9F|nr:hypothetical protein [Oceanobacillus profundus]MCM3396780.1 hypothetical protein [Oceanobacillus profundus]